LLKMAEKEVAILAEKLAKLVDIFRRGGKADDFNWWQGKLRKALFNPSYGYQDGLPLFEEIIEGVINLNPEMLSEYETEVRIIFDFLQKQTISVTKEEHLKNQDLINGAEAFLNKLIEFEAWRDVDVPIMNLWLEGDPVKLLKVTICGVTNEELEQWKKNASWFRHHQELSDVHVLARVRAPGDQQKAILYARTQANLALEVLRAFCFPFGQDSDTWRVGILGDIIASSVTPMRINNRDFVTQVSLFYPPYIEVRKHILSRLEQPQWKLVNELILKTQPSKMEKKLLLCIHWLAESTKPDTNNSKFAKISIALETLIGGEPKDENLKVRGITAMLAERAAFIAGGDFDDRLTIDKNIRKYYRIRGKVIHRGEGDVSLNDIDKFGQLVRRLALALLEKLDKLGDELSDVDKLERWVREQKYILSDHNSKEGLNAAG